MKQIQKQYKRILDKLKKNQPFLSLHKKVIMLSLVVVPLTSVGAGMTMHVDNSIIVEQKPVFINETVINLDENIIVKFVAPIQDTREYETMITTYPYTNMYFSWNNENTLLIITPKTIWQPSTEYSLAFPYNSYDIQTQLSAIFSFETVAYPEVIDTNIVEDYKTYINEGDEILITFNYDVSDFDIHAVIRPALKLKQTYDAEKRTLHVQIEERLQESKELHTLTLFAGHKKQEKLQFYPIKSLSFNILLPEPESWPETHDDRINAARNSIAPKINKGKYIDVNLDAQITTLFDNGKFVASFVNSSGASDTPTPTGEFHIYNKHPYALSGMFNVYLPYWMAFTEDGKYGFHDLIVWPEGHEDMPGGGKESENSIGNAVSPGCVRHDATNAQFIYDWADVGTIVKVY